MGFKLGVFPQYKEPWGECSWCGFDYPRHNLRLHRRFGWQCRYCWDGGPQHDELFYTPRPYEGTRRTAAPLTDTLDQGLIASYNFLDPGSLNVIFQNQGSNGTPAYRVSFETVLVEVFDTTDAIQVSGYYLGGGNYLGVFDGSLQVTLTPIPSAVPIPSSLLFTLSGGVFLYLGMAGVVVWKVTFTPTDIIVAVSSGQAYSGWRIDSHYRFFLLNGEIVVSTALITGEPLAPPSVGLSVNGSGELVYAPSL